MSTFMQVSAAAAVMGVIFSIMGNMLPSDKFAGQLRTVFALVLILVTVPRLVNADISLNLDGFDGYTYGHTEDTAGRFFEENVSRNICDSLREILTAENIYPSEISVNVNNSPDGSISIISAEIILDPSDSLNAEKAKQLAAEALGISTENVAVKTADGG
ncbi:MAG: hypothetical protein NC078_03635 [Ruminococcus sp.]|nr:hypothetical protein [Ruminococcus sp.]